MRSLFLKMFLWFCGTTAAIFLVISVGFLRDSPSALVTNWRDLGHRSVVTAAAAAAALHDGGNQAAASEYIDDWANGLGIRAALFDRSGAALTLTPLTLDASALRQLNTAPAAELVVLDRNRGLAGVRIDSPQGRSYLFVVMLPPRESGIWARAMLALFLAVGFLLCYGLARYITAPVRSLRSLARQFSRGDLSARVTMPAITRRRDEIGELARDFNHMAARIDSLVEAQRRLLADVSHELRSPLTRLSLALGLLQRRAECADSTSLARMSREIERLNSLIGQLLTLSRLEHLDSPGPTETLDLSAIVREVAADADFEASARRIAVRLMRCDACTMQGTADLVRSAIENVVRNAVKYTNPQTEVTMELIRTPGGGAADVVVRDQGPGLPEEELAHVFEPFYRVDAARERHTGGAGLGLAITRRVATLYGGHVSAENLPDGGLELRLTFPVL